jgi:thiol-disulfide isomerase/thioredoxin
VDPRRRAAPILLTLALLAGCGGGEKSHARASCPEPKGLISVGERMPLTCTLELADGGVLRLKDLVGKPAVINFWATWCTYCVDEMPAIEMATLPVRSKVAIIGADLLDVDGETRSAATKFVRRTGVTYQIAYDRDGVLFGNFSGQLLLPVTIFIKADGRVAFRQFGPLTVATMRDDLKRYLGVR